MQSLALSRLAQVHASSSGSTHQLLSSATVFRTSWRMSRKSDTKIAKRRHPIVFCSDRQMWRLTRIHTAFYH